MIPGMSGLGWPPDLHSLLGVWWEAMGRACLDGTLILCGAFVLARLLRRVQAGVRCWIWRLAFLKLFLLFGCFLTISLPLLPTRSSSGITTQTGGGGIGATKLVAGTRPASAFGRGSVSVSEEAEPASEGHSDWSGFLEVLLLGVWSLGMLFGLVRLVRQYREAAALVRSACPITDSAIQAEFSQVGRALGLPGRPDLRVSDLTDVPLLFGLLRPTIVLPTAVVTGFPPEACRVILAHELAHVKRQDLAWSVLTGLARVLFFFHPLVWWAHRELRTVQEICCDAHAIHSASVSAHTYGEVLVRVAANQTSSTQDGRIAVAMAESFTTLQRRLEEMQTIRFHSGWKRWTPMMAAVIGGAALLPWQIKAQTQAPTEERAAARIAQFPQKSINNRTLQLGEYTLKVLYIPPKERPTVNFTPVERQLMEANGLFWLDIGGANKENLMLVHGAMNLRGKDDRDRIVLGPVGVLAQPEIAVSPKNESVNRAVLAVLTEAGAKSLKSLEGDLVVEDGKVRTFTFPADGLRPEASQHMGPVNVTIHSAEYSKGRYRLEATCTFPYLSHPGTTSPLEKAAEDIGNHRQPQWECVGTDGVVYKSRGGSGMFTVTPFNTPHDDDRGEATRTMTGQSTIVFDRLPDTFHPASIVVRVVEEQGANLRVPFKFTDIPLADPL